MRSFTGVQAAAVALRQTSRMTALLMICVQGSANGTDMPHMGHACVKGAANSKHALHGSTVLTSLPGCPECARGHVSRWSAHAE